MGLLLGSESNQVAIPIPKTFDHLLLEVDALLLQVSEHISPVLLEGLKGRKLRQSAVKEAIDGTDIDAELGSDLRHGHAGIAKRFGLSAVEFTGLPWLALRGFDGHIQNAHKIAGEFGSCYASPEASPWR